MPFLGLPPPPIPQQSPVVPPCQNSNMPPPSHLISIPAINSSPIVPTISTPATDQLGTEYVKTQNDFVGDQKSSIYMQPQYQAPQQSEQVCVHVYIPIKFLLFFIKIASNKLK